MSFNVSLEKLYKVESSCCYNEQSQFCPVVLKVGENLLGQDEFKNGYDDPYTHLLQVWSKNGKLVFEHKLKQAPYSINMCGTDLVWQEEKETCDIYLLRMHKKAPTRFFKFYLQNNELFKADETKLVQFSRNRRIMFLPRDLVPRE